MTFPFLIKDTLAAEVREALAAARTGVLFFDYDGTLVPIKQSPELAVLSKKTFDLLQRAVVHPCLTVGIVTGRSLEDIRSLVGLEGLLYVANHGHEIQTTENVWVSPPARRAVPALQELRSRLNPQLEGFKGIWVEDKRFTLSIHYRRAGRSDVVRARNILRRESSAVASDLIVRNGKRVWEIRPSGDWDKGRGTLEVLKRIGRSKSLVFYFGDDKTDEDAFRVLSHTAVTVHVGYSRRTEAHYSVPSTTQVANALGVILDTWAGSKEYAD